MTATRHRLRTRRGAILLVVLALLALFAVIGLSFVLYAESAGTAARIHREEMSRRERPDPAAAAGLAVNQIVFGPVDPTSAIRGHDLATLMYGRDGTTPYNGVGLIHEPLDIPTGGRTTLQIDRADALFHGLLLFDRPNPFNASDPVLGAVVDPGYTQGNGQVRNGDLVAGTLPGENTLTSSPWVYVPKNAAYTYPDVNNALVAAADPTTGRVFVPSAHRPRLFFRNATANDWFGSTDANDPTRGALNPNWFTPAGRLKLLRPRRIDNLTAAERQALRNKNLWPVPVNPTASELSQLSAALADGPNGVGKFPNPSVNPDGSVTGDVQNYKFGAGVQRNDSVWLDLGLPTQDYKGRRLAPLVAITLLPLDGKINVSASGNLANGGSHGSNMGFGPHEINPAAVLQAPADAATLATTKYSPAGGNKATAPGGGTTAQAMAVAVTSKGFLPGQPATALPAAYAQVDWAGTASAGWLSLPGAGGASALASSPTYTVTGAAAATNHPALWSAFARPQYQTSDPTNAPAAAPVPHAFPLTDLRLFAGRYSGKTTDYNAQTFLDNTNRGTGTAFQTEFDNGASQASARVRAQVTPFSVGFAKGGLSPNWFGTVSTSPVYNTTLTYQSGQPGPVRSDPTGTVSAATQPQLDVQAILSLPNTGANQSVAQGDERQRAYPFASPASSQVRIQNLRAALGAVNLNRPLADYRTAAAVTANQPLAQAGAGNNQQAALDRQKLAEDIFIRLAVATGARVGFDNNLAAPAAQYGAGVNPSNPSRFMGYVLPQPTGTATSPSYKLTVGGTDLTPAPTAGEYDALRWLAQLAANIVDAVDADDVSTAFVWNASPAAAFGTTLSGANYAAHFQPATPVPGDTYTSGPLAMRVVFGTERPRLVLNEAYGELANNKADKSGPKATKDFRARFWVELLNPLGTEAANSLLAGPDATNLGAVPLVQGASPVYKLQVFDKGTPVLQQLRRSRNVTGLVDTNDSYALGGVGGDTPAQITGSKITTTATATDQTNRLDCSLAGLTPAPGNPSATYVEANNGVGAATGTTRSGFAVVGPNINKGNANDGVAFTPDDASGQPFGLALYKAENSGANVAGTVSDALDYLVAQQKATNIKSQAVDPLNADPNRHVVLLRRLANPYLAANDPLVAGFDPINQPPNPYITVDVLSQVQVYDGVKYGNDPSGPANNNDQDATDASRRHSVGRVQPYAGYQDDVTGAAPQYQYPSAAASSPTLTLKQLGKVTGTSVGGKDPGLSFFRHNSKNGPTDTPAGPPTTANDPAAGGIDPTILTPFDWLAQFDRPLVNQMELLHVSAYPPQLLTRQFMTPVPSSPTVTRHAHDLQHRDTVSTMAPYNYDGPLFQRDANQGFASPLYRALDLLQTKPWTHGTPTDGRQAGRININMIWDGDQSTPSNVFRAVLDAQQANGFYGTAGAPNTNVDLLWQAVVKSRSPQWALGGAGTVGVTADELGANPTAVQFDRPFKGLGAGMFSATATPIGLTPPGTSPYGAGVVFPTGGALGTQFKAQPPGLEDTLLRRVGYSGTAPTTHANGLPFLFQNPATPTAGQPVHPYQQWEPLRKAFNSFTTTSDSFVLMMTVGFFEVVEEPDPAGRPTRILRQEFYDDAPGDLRAQYVAVLDRTGIATDRNQANQPQTAQQPWTLEVANTIPANDTSVPATKAELVGGFALAQDQTGWPGTGAAPQQSEGTYNTSQADGTGGFYFITPTFQRNGGTIIASPTSTQTYNLSGLYDGAPVPMAATFNPNDSGTPVNTTRATTAFFLGAGDRAEQVEAYFDGTTKWSYNPTTGALRVTVRPVQSPQLTGASPLAVTHEGGGVASNVVFRNPGPQPSKTLKPGQTDPVVRMFGELK